MKVVLINPPYVGWLNDIKVEPVGLLYIASYLRQLGHEVHLYDPYIGDEESVYLALLRDFKPDVIGCSVYTVSEEFCFEQARIAKLIQPGSIFVAGGPHSTFCAERMLQRCPDIDIISKKEGELTLASILDWVQNGKDWDRLSDIKGISFLKEKGNVESDVLDTGAPESFQDIDQIPMPAKDMLSEKYYSLGTTGVLPKGYRSTGIVSARGCAYKCDFCVSPVFFHGVRKHSIERVRSEIIQMKEQRGITHVHFYDDVFAYSLKRMIEVRDNIGPLGITWDCYIRIDCITQDMLTVMKEAGCIQVRFGVETGGAALREQRKGGKTASEEKHRDVVRWCRELGIETLASYIIGFPDETEADIQNTIDFADAIDTDRVGFYKLTPYPGTIYWNMMKNHNIDYDNYVILENEISLNSNISSTALNDWVRTAYNKFYEKREMPCDDPDTLRFLTSLPKLAY